MDNLPVYLFHQGTNYRSYEYFGSRIAKRGDKVGVLFRVYAKNAKSVSVVGDFNEWNAKKHPMQKITDGGIFEAFIEGLKQYDNYKYAVTGASGKTVLKADPFAFHAETTPGTASKVYDLSGYEWGDGEYMQKRETADVYSSPINIYEVNLGSWMKKDNGDVYSYRELAVKLVSYVKKAGYTHIELMPLTEYPFDGSWGYQVTGYFAVTSRFGTPHDFMYFIDRCHKNGIGVILDWVPAHFPKDEHGLYEFDGTCMYEYSDPLMREHKSWGTRVFDYGKTEVQSFLTSSAVFFFDKYHIDGLRVDAVASMLYLDYDRKAGEWRPNEDGGNINKQAVAFLRKVNAAVFADFKGVMMVAEESTAFPLVTMPVSHGGLGFNFKWNMGWMNDALSYMQSDPYFRGGCHNKLTFSMMYAFSENFVLPVSHDEVVHGKKSLIDKMPGSYEDKFANLRAFMGYMYSHPGKKLNFMGSEIGQFKEWAYKEGIEFFLLDYEAHKKYFNFIKRLNKFYLNTPAFYEIEKSWEGFNWLVADDKTNNVIAYERISSKGERVLAIINFSGVDQKGYRIGTGKGKFKVAFDSDLLTFGGNSTFSHRTYAAKRAPAHGRKHSIAVDIAKLSFLYLIKVE